MKNYEKNMISKLPVVRSKFHSNSIEFLLKMDDFGAPGGQVQISFKFYQILIKNGRFRSSRLPGQISFKFY